MKTFKFSSILGLGMLALLMAVTSATAATKSVSLAWDANTEPEVAGYRVYYGNTPGNYSSIINAGADTATTVNNLTVGTTYYFVVTAYYANGVESAPSEEIAHAVAFDPTFQLDALPVSRVVSPGSAVTLSVSATGPESLTYQWNKDGTAIPGATGATYTIPEMSSDTIGAYSVTVGDSGATLSTPPAVISTVLMKLPQTIAIEGVPGAAYEISYQNGLSSSNWSQLTNLSLTSNRMEWQDSSASNASHRFYRITPAE